MAMIFFFAMPRLCQYCMAIFKATSTAVLPLSEKNTLRWSEGRMLKRFFDRAIAGSCVNPAKMTCSNTIAWAAMAWAIFGLLCPWRLTHQEETASIRSEEHTSELQSLMRISYAVFCLKKNKQHSTNHHSLNP